MPDYVKPYIERIEAFAKARGESIELLLVGGLALSLYGLPRYTIQRSLSSKGENLYNSQKILRRYYLKRNSSI